MLASPAGSLHPAIRFDGRFIRLPLREFCAIFATNPPTRHRALVDYDLLIRRRMVRRR
jgi:hypothetical protein